MFSSKVNIAVLCEHSNPALNSLPSLSNVNFVVGYNPCDFVNNPHIHEVEAVVVIQPSDMSVIDSLWTSHLTQVKWVHSFYAGVDSLATFVRKHIQPQEEVVLTNGKGAFSSSLGEYIMAASLHFNKQICRLQENKAHRKWEKFVMPTLKDRTMGFIGFGDIAKAAARIAKHGFGMNIAVYRRHPEKNITEMKSDEQSEGLVDIPFTDSHDIFAQCDFIVCSLPGTPETYKFCTASHFAAMKKNAVFISCGRGSAVDEEALCAALCNGDRVIYAALDVFHVEPLPPSSPLWLVPQDRLLLTSHNADYTEDYFDLGWQVFKDNLECFVEGRPMITTVNKTLLY